MSEKTLKKLAEDMASVIPSVDSKTKGQYGDGIGSEDEETQVELIMGELRDVDSKYENADIEVGYSKGVCDLRLHDETFVEAKLLRYWRANGDPEDYMYNRVFSPFHKNTLMSDAKTLHESSKEKTGLLRFFYKRSDEDRENVYAFPEGYTAENVAGKIVNDI
jgi:hypothetical protein